MKNITIDDLQALAPEVVELSNKVYDALNLRESNDRDDCTTLICKAILENIKPRIAWGEEAEMRKTLERVCNAFGIYSPLALIGMAENNEQTFGDILVKHIESELGKYKWIQTASDKIKENNP